MNAEVEAQDRKKLVAVVLGLSAVIGLMLLAFVLPSVNSGPHELKLGITGQRSCGNRTDQHLARGE